MSLISINTPQGPPKSSELTAVELQLKQFELLREMRHFEKTTSSLEEQRILTFSGVVRSESVSRAAMYLTEFAVRNQEPITIRIMSPGGSVLDGLALYDAIQETKRLGVKVETVGIGYTASMAGVLLQAGTHRVMSANAYFHIHEVSGGSIGSVNEMKDSVQFTEKLWVHLSDILAAGSTFEAEELRDWVERRDRWMTAQEALAYGFVDEVR